VSLFLNFFFLKLSASDCKVLVDRISGRIGSWTSKNLSFAGRLQLLSSVLYSLQVFWSGIFILPKKIIRDISQKFNRFLWNGKDSNSAKAKVAWNDVCFPKKEGGLGLKNLEVWNRTSIMRHIWNLFACAGSIWVAWIKMYLLKGRSFWSVNIPQDCFWCWRSLLKLRNIVRDFIFFEVGDGQNIHLWFDNWHPCGVLIERYGSRVVYDARSGLNSKLSSVLSNGNWCWNPARSEDLVAIQSRLPEIVLGHVDKPVWKIARNGSFVSSETWNFLRDKKAEVEWWHLIWFPYAIPKHAFILWLAVHNRLTTSNRLLLWGFNGDPLCGFCHHVIESRNHLFF
jgi:hypothetical protein